MFRAGLARIGLTDSNEVAKDYFEKAKECREKRKFEEALEYLTSITSLPTESESWKRDALNEMIHRAYCEIGDIKWLMGKFDEAYDNADQALRYCLAGRPYCIMGLARYSAKRYPEAIAAFDQCLVAMTYDEHYLRYTTHFNRAIAKFELKQYAEAESDCRYAIIWEGDHRSEGAHLVQGRCNFFLKHYSSAISDLTTAISRKPDRGELYCTRGEVYFALSEDRKAANDFEVALSYGYSDAGEKLAAVQRKMAPPPPVPAPVSVRTAASSSTRPATSATAASSRASLPLSTALREISDSEMREAMTSARRLGAGSFGEVHWARLRDGQSYAVKSIRTDHADERMRDDFFNEARIMANLNHPLIVHLYGYCKSDSATFYLVMEYMALGSLYKVLHSSEELSASVRLDLFLNVANALRFLHDRGVIHRDLKSENVLLKLEDGKRCAKIGDFGLSKVRAVGSKARGYQVGTAQWTAPEIFSEMPATDKSDVYSLGVILWELLTRLSPLDGKSAAIIGHLVMGGRVEDMRKVPRDVPTKLLTVMQGCLSINPDERPTVTEIVETLSRRGGSGSGGGGGAGYASGARAYSAATGAAGYSIRGNDCSGR